MTKEESKHHLELYDKLQSENERLKAELLGNSEQLKGDDKPLTECMMGRDSECNHPKCPVTDEDERNGRYCTLPLHDYRQ